MEALESGWHRAHTTLVTRFGGHGEDGRGALNHGSRETHKGTGRHRELIKPAVGMVRQPETEACG